MRAKLNFEFKQLGLIKTVIDGTKSKVIVGNCLSSSFPIENDVKQRDALSILLYNMLLGIYMELVTRYEWHQSSTDSWE